MRREVRETLEREARSSLHLPQENRSLLDYAWGGRKEATVLDKGSQVAEVPVETAHSISRL